MPQTVAERQAQPRPTLPKLATSSLTFPLFPQLPTELQALVFSHAAALDSSIYYDTLESFLHSKLESLVDYESDIHEWCDGTDGKLDPLRPFILLLSPYVNLVDTGQERISGLFRTRTSLLWTSQLARRAALETWKSDLEAYCGWFNVVWMERSEGWTIDERLAKKRFVGILEELLEDVRGTLGGKPSQLPELWKRQEECKSRVARGTCRHPGFGSDYSI